MKIQLNVNEQPREVDVEEDTPLVWVLREDLRLCGTRFGCGAALCGACTVHVDGVATRSCVLPVGTIAGRKITTIEGLGGEHPVQKAWCAENAPQCGYCQSGQVMSAVALLRATPKPTDEDIDLAMAGNICRCGSYPRIRLAILRAANEGGAI
jgi:aerobic-type carbon monoxide dehydrogenase small subunit (CoxS/CutS family)